MARADNYAIQAGQAKERFLGYDQQAIIAKFGLKYDAYYLYIRLLGQEYRISRKNGDMERWLDGFWVDGNSYNEVMTILDLVCDSREDRRPSGEWKSMQSFGMMFHQNLLEEKKDPWAERFQADPEGLRRACIALGGEELPGGDISYALELFDGLKIGLQFWEGDEEFAPRLRWLWDGNARMYIRYETMYFAVALVLQRIGEKM